MALVDEASVDSPQLFSSPSTLKSGAKINRRGGNKPLMEGTFPITYSLLEKRRIILRHRAPSPFPFDIHPLPRAVCPLSSRPFST